MKRTGHRIEDNGCAAGHATCQCGWTSPLFSTKAACRKAHQAHLASLPEPRCRIDGCENPPNAREMCGSHYTLWRNNGAPVRLTPDVRLQRQLATRPFCAGPDAADRFWPRVERVAPDECWSWLGTVGGDGYGQWSYQGRVWRAHRVAYELSVGPIGYEMSIDHLCGHTLCVNPAHLDPCTLAENSRRQWERKKVTRA